MSERKSHRKNSNAPTSVKEIFEGGEKFQKETIKEEIKDNSIIDKTKKRKHSYDTNIKNINSESTKEDTSKKKGKTKENTEKEVTLEDHKPRRRDSKKKSPRSELSADREPIYCKESIKEKPKKDRSKEPISESKEENNPKNERSKESVSGDSEKENDESSKEGSFKERISQSTEMCMKEKLKETNKEASKDSIQCKKEIIQNRSIRDKEVMKEKEVIKESPTKKESIKNLEVINEKEVVKENIKPRKEPFKEVIIIKEVEKEIIPGKKKKKSSHQISPRRERKEFKKRNRTIHNIIETKKVAAPKKYSLPTEEEIKLDNRIKEVIKEKDSSDELPKYAKIPISVTQDLLFEQSNKKRTKHKKQSLSATDENFGIKSKIPKSASNIDSLALDSLPMKGPKTRKFESKSAREAEEAPLKKKFRTDKTSPHHHSSSSSNANNNHNSNHHHSPPHNHNPLADPTINISINKPANNNINNNGSSVSPSFDMNHIVNLKNSIQDIRALLQGEREKSYIEFGNYKAKTWGELVNLHINLKTKIVELEAELKELRKQKKLEDKL